MKLTFTVDGKPQAKQRPRFTRNGHAYTPNKTAYYEREVRRAYKDLYGDVVLAGEVDAIIRAYFAPPTSVSKKRRKLMFTDLIQPTKKPDCDNIAKAVLDALNGVAYKDDSQVVTLRVSKHYSDIERVEVELYGRLEL